MVRLSTLGKGTALLMVFACGCAGGMQSAGADPQPGVTRPRELPVQGIDVSRYQGRIDWSLVRSHGIRFAYIKATEGGDLLDARFRENWEGAAAAGVPRGAYHFMYWCRPASEQAAWFAEAVPQDTLQLPPVLDLEWNTASPTCRKCVQREHALEEISVMLSLMERHTGKRPVIYTDTAFYRNVLEGELAAYPFWLRSIADEPARRFPGRPWTFWQYSETGRVSGIEGNVDLNAFRGSETDWQRWVKGQ